MPSIDRHEAREICLAHFNAREVFWARAQREGVEPTEPPYKTVAEATTDLPGLPRRYLVWGMDPGVWPCREWPEWVAWRRARDKAVAANLGLIGRIMARAKISPSDRMFDDAQSGAMRGLLRGVDLWDPHRENAPSTYFGRWISQGIQQGRGKWRKYARLASTDTDLGDGAMYDDEITEDPRDLTDLVADRWEQGTPCDPPTTEPVWADGDLVVHACGCVVWAGMPRRV